MPVYQIDYDLRKNRDYQTLYERIRRYDRYCRPLESAWIISTNQSAVQVRDYLAEVMDADDGLLVTKLKTEAAWRGLGPSEVSRDLKSLLETQAA